MRTTLQIQTALRARGFAPGPLDGIIGPQTERAIREFNRSNGFPAVPHLGPQALALLFPTLSPSSETQLPWMNEVAKYMGLHEANDFAKLFAWMRSDGASVGDPRKFPWCGDLVQTAIRLTLPDEPFPGRVGQNPYLARNWMDFGVSAGPAYGAIAVFWRGSKAGISGHVCFAIGYDPARKLIRCRGGNQSNSVSDTWIAEDRLLGYRWPSTHRSLRPMLPTMNSKGAVVSRNEA